MKLKMVFETVIGDGVSTIINKYRRTGGIEISLREFDLVLDYVGDAYVEIIKD